MFIVIFYKQVHNCQNIMFFNIFKGFITIKSICHKKHMYNIN